MLVVPGRALASVSPDGERSVNFVLQWSYFIYKFVTKVKDLVILLGDRVYSDHRIFCDLVGDNLSSPRSGELADIAWGNVGLPSRLQNVGSLEERLQKYFSMAHTRFRYVPYCMVVVTIRETHHNHSVQYQSDGHTAKKCWSCFSGYFRVLS